jgi:hypothetical protein
VFLLEAALVGKIIHLKGEPLFQRRIHSGMATQAHLTQESRLHFIDPKAEVTTSYLTKLYLEYLRSPFQMDELGPAEKALCVSTIVSGVLFKRARIAQGKYRRRLISRFRR